MFIRFHYILSANLIHLNLKNMQFFFFICILGYLVNFSSIVVNSADNTDINTIAAAKKKLEKVVEDAIFLGEKCSTSNKNEKQFGDNEKAILHEFLTMITNGDDPDPDSMQKWIKNLKANVFCSKKFENGFSEAESVPKNRENMEDKNSNDLKFIQKVEILRKKICSTPNLDGIVEDKMEILLDELVNHPSIRERIDAAKIKAGIMGKIFLEKNFEMEFLQFAEAVKDARFQASVRMHSRVQARGARRKRRWPSASRALQAATCTSVMAVRIFVHFGAEHLLPGHVLHHGNGHRVAVLLHSQLHLRWIMR